MWDSIRLPNFTPQFYYKTDSTGPFMLSATYDNAACKNINFHIKLENVVSGSIGCLVDVKSPNSNQASFQPTEAYDTVRSFVRGADVLNRCGINIEQVCTKSAIESGKQFTIYVTSDGCNSSIQKSYTFTCIGSSTVSKSTSFKKRQEIALNIPPRHMRCPTGTEGCRTGGSMKHGFRWKCLESDQIDSCGGCPGDDDAIDCTELPGISAVQCLAKKCIVAQCRRGYDLIDNECVNDQGPELSQRPQIVITERSYRKRSRDFGPSRVRAYS